MTTTRKHPANRRISTSVTQGLSYWTNAIVTAGAIAMDRLRRQRTTPDRYEHEQLMVWDDESPAAGQLESMHAGCSRRAA